MGILDNIGTKPQFELSEEEKRRLQGALSQNIAANQNTAVIQNMPTQKPSLFQRFNQPQNWAALSNAFNTLRFQPDQNLAAANQQIIQAAQQTRSANKSIDYLKSAGVPDDQIQAAMNNPELMKALLSAVISSQYKKPADSYTTVSGAQLAEMGMPGFDPNKMYSYNNATKKISSIGGEGPTVNVSTGGEDAYAKKLGEGRAEEINTLAAGASKARELMNSVSVLEALSPAVGETAIPGFLRRFVPEGVSSPIDAYNSTLNGLAAALRVPGSGAQSDKDVDLLLARGGSIAASPEARAISHSALRTKAEIEMQIGQLAIRHRSDPQEYTYAQFNQDRQKLLDQPILSDEQRRAIEGLGSSSASQRLMGVDLANLSAQQLDDLERELESRGQ